MQNLDARLASFGAITKPKTKARPAFPLSPSTHPHLTPETLSQAGFHYTPGSSSTSVDNCKCFLCNVELGGWDEDDDPFQEHARRGNCAWAEMVCGVKIEKRKRDKSDGTYVTTYLTPESLPQSTESAAVREQTFKKWWPHKQKSGWLPTVKNLARAGFVYTPTGESKDLVMCPYCEYAVEGWEATDDPWQIHQTKVPDCHFFRAEIAGGGPSATKPASKSSTRSKKSEVSKRSKRGTTAAATVLSDAEEEPEPAHSTVGRSDDEVSVVPSQSTKQRATKPRATTSKAKSTGRGKKKAATVEPDTETEHEVINVDDTADTIVVATLDEMRVDEAGQQDSALDDEVVEEVKVKKTRKPRATKAKTRGTAKSKQKADEESAQSQTQTDDEPFPTKSEIESIAEEVEPQPESEVEAETQPLSQSVKQSSASGRSQSKSTRSAPSSSSASNHTSQSSKSKPSASSKPLPPLPPPSLPTSPSPDKSKRPLSQLDRFANIPPSSPISPSQTMTPRAKSTLRSAQPQSSKASPHANLPREVLETSLTRGALEARKVIEDLMSSPIPTPSGPARQMSRNPATDNVEEAKGGGREEGLVKLTEEQKGMTLEDLIRYEMDRRYDQLRQEGEEMIAAWERRTKDERVKIESI